MHVTLACSKERQNETFSIFYIYTHFYRIREEGGSGHELLQYEHIIYHFKARDLKIPLI